MTNAVLAGSLPTLTPGNSDRVSILVVDDNTSGAQTLSMLLDLDGYEVSVVHSGEDALLHVDRYKPAIILLDIGLPDMSGYEVARRIRALSDGQLPFIMAVTGWGSDRDQERAREAGCDLHMTKPVNFEHLERVLKNAVRR
jgi:DNA-binding response OmpR family regulator